MEIISPKEPDFNVFPTIQTDHDRSNFVEQIVVSLQRTKRLAEGYRLQIAQRWSGIGTGQTGDRALVARDNDIAAVERLDKLRQVRLGVGKPHSLHDIAQAKARGSARRLEGRGLRITRKKESE